MSILTTSAQADLIREYLKTGPLVWSEMQKFTVPSGYEQHDWQEILDTLPIHAFEEAGDTKIQGYPITSLKDIGTKHNGKPLAVEGKVVSLSEREPDPKTVSWVCIDAGHKNPSSKFGKQPSVCGECACTDFDIEITHETRDLQAIRIQQDNLTLSVVVRDESLINSVKSGKSAYAFGVMTFEPYIDRQTKKAKFRKYLEAVNLECDERTTILTAEDIARIKAEMEQPQFYDKMLGSMAPFIHGMEALKESGMLAVASIGIKNPHKTLWVGDPSVAKSDGLEYFADLAPNGHYTTAPNTRYTGLTTTSEKDEETGRWMVTPGLFAHAHNGLICIDEIQTTKGDALKNLNDVIERGKIRYALAGGNFGELDANCALIMGCNPYTGRINVGENIQTYLKFLDNGVFAFISRMTLIYFFRDVVNEANDKAIAKKILRHSGENPRAKYLEDWKDASGVEYFGENTLKKIFAYVSTIRIEEIPEEHDEVLINHYWEKRKDTFSQWKGMITHRFLRNSIRLAQVIARVQGKTTPDLPDIDRAVQLLSKSQNETAFDPTTGEIDANIINGVEAKSSTDAKQSKEDEFWATFNSLIKTGEVNGRSHEYVSRVELESKLIANGWKEGTPHRYITAMMRGNPPRLYEPLGMSKLTKL